MAYMPGLFTAANATVIFAPGSGSLTQASVAVTGLSCAAAIPPITAKTTIAIMHTRIALARLLISTPVYVRRRTTGTPLLYRGGRSAETVTLLDDNRPPDEPTELRTLLDSHHVG